MIDLFQKPMIPSLPPLVSQPLIIDQPCETPIITPVDINPQPVHSEKEVKKLLIRIVKAVQLHGKSHFTSIKFFSLSMTQKFQMSNSLIVFLN